MVRVSLLQLQLPMDKPGALKHVSKMLARAASAGSDVVCLPELWYTKAIKCFEREFKVIVDAAKEHNMIVIPGAFLEVINDKSYISCPVIAASGSILGRQLKIHPFGVQKKHVEGGTKAEIFDSGKLKFGVVVCYDVVFPEVARWFVNKGAEILFLPSKVRNEGIKPWHMYAQVRALENRVSIAAPNVCDSISIYKGKSICVDFDYNNKSDIAIPKITVASTHEHTLVVDVDLKLAKKIRKRRFEDFKNNIYHSL